MTKNELIDRIAHYPDDYEVMLQIYGGSIELYGVVAYNNIIYLEGEE